ncbi:unnamed protein product [Penicillium egyptiacum]|uniref:F-box domain-containing protein n=1 Tax=Penicillium egyptiacum TaxID=1303716 RepID=A0A9W4KPX7_9EURO|nr:unnamed protein product [Penicillium egyptiacum]
MGRRTPPSEIPKLNTLAGLPVELLSSITDFLPLNDRICISLCSRRLFAIFNHRTNPARPLGKDKLPVLRRLERDLPKYFVCYICHILHKYDGSEYFGLSGSVYDQEKCPLRCLPKWKEDGFDLELRDQAPIWFHVYRIFYFLHLQLAMRRFYYGEKFGISTEALSYTQVRTHPGPSSCPEITSLFSTDAQICPKTPGLCLRIQHVMFVHGRKSELLLSRQDIESAGEPPQVMFICIHVSRRRHAILLNTVVKAYISGEKAPSSTHTCDICAADSRIEVCEYGSDLALVLTTWINLGPGLTPDDPRWLVHCCSWELNRVTLDPNHRKDSPRVCFENVSPRSLEALRSCNLSYLKDQRYKRVMHQVYWERGVWDLPTKSSWGSYWFMS